MPPCSWRQSATGALHALQLLDQGASSAARAASSAQHGQAHGLLLDEADEADGGAHHRGVLSCHTHKEEARLRIVVSYCAAAERSWLVMHAWRAS